jgi:hypothetical protein
MYLCSRHHGRLNEVDAKHPAAHWGDKVTDAQYAGG